MNIHNLDQLFFESNPVKEKKLIAGEYVFYQGDPARYIYAVKTGEIRLERPTLEGRSVLIHVAGNKDSFAEASLFAEKYHCNAIATVASTIHIYPKDLILKALQSQPDKAEKYIALLSSHVRNLRAKLELRNILSARDRIMQYFLLIADADTREIILHVPLKEMAAELGLAYETFYRQLARMEKEGVIKRNKNKILLCGADMIEII